MRFAIYAVTLAILFALHPLGLYAQRRSGPEVARSRVFADPASVAWVSPASSARMRDWSAVVAVAGEAESGRLYFSGALSASLPWGLGGSLSTHRFGTPRGIASGFSASLSVMGGRQWDIGLRGRLDRWTPEGELNWDADVQAIWRPSSRLGLEVTAERGLGFWQAETEGPTPRVSLSAGLRPYASSALTLELGAHLDRDYDWGLRAYTGLRVPQVGLLHVGWEYQEREGEEAQHILQLGLELAYGRSIGHAGATLDANESSTPGWFAGAGLTGRQQRGLPTRRFVQTISLQGQTGPRGILDIVRRLDQARFDARVAGVVLSVIRADLSLAYAQEIRLMIRALQEAGKPVTCIMQSPSGPEAYLCAAARHRVMDDAGFVRFTGLSSRRILLGGAMERLGVRADFLRIGRYKDAPEPLTNRSSSDHSRQQRRALVTGAAARMAFDVSEDLSIGVREAAALINEGPYTAREASTHRIITHTEDAARWEEERQRFPGGSYPTVSRPTPYAEDSYGGGAPIGVVVIDENIVDGDNVDIPFLEIRATGSDTAIAAIDALAADPAVRVIVLRVDSPGGSALASERIWRAIRRARERKPVIASMGRVAASGGYFAACAADEIWANPSTVTGSIGILMGKIDWAPLAARWGIETELDATSPRAGALSMWAPFTAEQRSVLAELLRVGYRRFLERVAEGREMSVEEVHRLAEGRVWTGDAALRHGLVDHLGGFGAALARAREIANLSPDARTVILPTRPRHLIEYLLPTGQARIRAPSAVREGLRRWWSVIAADEDTALALMPESTSLR